jgi:nucleotide-binding universal stress UspA family protein
MNAKLGRTEPNSKRHARSSSQAPTLKRSFGGGGVLFRRILVPVDDSAASSFAAKYAFDISKLLGSHVFLTHVIIDDAPSDQSSAQALLTRLAQSARFHPELRIITSEGRSIAACILELAKNERIDLIIIGTRGHQGLEPLMLGSVTQAVVGSAEIPVQIIPPSPPVEHHFAQRWRKALQR